MDSVAVCDIGCSSGIDRHSSVLEVAQQVVFKAKERCLRVFTWQLLALGIIIITIIGLPMANDHGEVSAQHAGMEHVRSSAAIKSDGNLHTFVFDSASPGTLASGRVTVTTGRTPVPAIMRDKDHGRCRALRYRQIAIDPAIDTANVRRAPTIEYDDKKTVRANAVV
jgi:hypothetical protein